MLILFFVMTAMTVFALQENYYPKGLFNAIPALDIKDSKLDNSGKSDAIDLVWSDNFENQNNWTFNGCWEKGAGNVGTLRTYEGNNCLGTNLNGLYPNNDNSTVKSIPINLPSSKYIELSFYEWFELENDYDYGYVDILVGSNSYRIDSRSGTSGNQWRRTSLNLTQFAGKQIQIVFNLATDASVSGSGWYIDQTTINCQERNPLNLRITSLDTTLFPSIYANVAVNNNDGFVKNLTPENFVITENGETQTNNLTVMAPANRRTRTMIDVVFLLDCTGSMATEINFVKANMVSFINAMITDSVDYNIGFVAVGDIFYMYNNNTATFFDSTMISQMQTVVNSLNIGVNGIGTGGDWKENQVGAMADAAQYPWRVGSNRMIILMTDATAHEGDTVTNWTMSNLLSSRLNPNNITVHAIFDTHHVDQIVQYMPLVQATGGTYHHIYWNFNSILSTIEETSASNYSVHYTSNSSLDSPLSRLVNIKAINGAQIAEDNHSWLPFSAPTLSRTDLTCSYDQASQHDYQSKELSVTVKDQVFPFVQKVCLYWRAIGQTEFNQVKMIKGNNDTYSYTLPSNVMTGLGIEYYFSAFDGQVQKTLPATYPDRVPFSFAIAPYQSTNILNSTALQTSSNIITVTALTENASNPTLDIYYREMGMLVYNIVRMKKDGDNTYKASLDTNKMNNGIQYFIKAVNELGISSYDASYDYPVFAPISHEIRMQNTGVQANISDLQFYPNPVNLRSNSKAISKIRFSIAKDANVKTKIYNIKGELVKTIADKNYSKGQHSVLWDSKNSTGSTVGSGIYFYMIESEGHKVAGKFIILK